MVYIEQIMQEMNGAPRLWTITTGGSLVDFNQIEGSVVVKECEGV